MYFPCSHLKDETAIFPMKHMASHQKINNHNSVPRVVNSLLFTPFFPFSSMLGKHQPALFMVFKLD